MSDAVNRIRELLDALPSKDISIGIKFLDKRDFDSLKELVDSALLRAKKHKMDDYAYNRLSIDDLNRLKSEVDVYKAQLDIPIDDFYNDDEDFNEEEEEYYG